MILQQGIPAASGGRIVERLAKVVAPQKPLEATARTCLPEGIAGDTVGLEAGGKRRVRFQRLLVEAGALAALRPETVTSDGREVSALRRLPIEQPAQRGE